TRFMKSVGKPSAESSRVGATSAGNSPFGPPYFTFTCVPSASAHLNFGVVPPTGSATNAQSTSAFESNASGPDVFLLKSADAGITRGGAHTLARASAASRVADFADELTAGAAGASMPSSRLRPPAAATVT